MYSTVKFFKDKDESFVVWITKILAPLSTHSQDYIYREGEDIDESKRYKIKSYIVYFLVKGHAAYVLPRFNNSDYYEIN